MSARAAAAADLAQRLGHAFADPALLERALTHKSVGQGARKVDDNERLEFLGDRVLNLLVADALLRRHPEEQEGELSKRLHGLVSGRTCAQVARDWGVGPALRLPGGETKRGARDQEVFLADACEALIAAVFLDAGLPAAAAVVEAAWGQALDAPAAPLAANAKTALQEWALGRGAGLPRYSVLARSGPEHQPVFRVSAAVDGLDASEGEGGSRREAEQAAARALLDREAHA